jgi:hypothetical protein
MNKENGNLKFEEFVQNSFNVPPISGEFYNNLYAELMKNAGNMQIFPKKSTNLVRIKRFSLVGLTIVLIIAISFLVSPSLRVMAENIFSFWKKVDNQQVITPIPEVPAVDPEKIPAIVESLQEEIKSTQQATASTEEEFIIKLPTLLPEGYRIVSVSNSPNGNAWVDLSSRNKGVYMTLTIQPAHLVEGSIIGPADRIEKVAINDLSGEYVRGGFGVGPLMTGYVKEEDAKNLTWSDDGNVHKLAWNDGNMNYLMIYAGSGDPGNPRYLGKNDMAKIAASMMPVENGVRPTVESFVPDNGEGEESVPYIKDFSTLKRLVGFDLPEPTYIPEKYTFEGGEAPFTGTALFEYFSCTPDPGEFDYENQFGFMLQMNKISENQLADEINNFADEVGENAVIETILINGMDVQYIKGDWITTWIVQDGKSVPQESVWDNDAYWHRLKWYKDGVLYSLSNYLAIQPDYQGSCALTKEDLIKFVEGLQ